MKIQSISVVIPTNRCINNCPFCVSKMHDNEYADITKMNPNSDDLLFKIKKRFKYAEKNGVTSLILTGTGEPLQNIRYMNIISHVLESMDHPFPNVEIQTTGVFLMNTKEYSNGEYGKTEKTYSNVDILRKLGVNTISLSVSNIFNTENNSNTIGIPETLRFDLNELCEFIKEKGFNLRLSLNMTKDYDNWTPKDILDKCKKLGADQITIRELYEGGKNTKEDIWVRDNRMAVHKLALLNGYIAREGKDLYKLPFGATVYSIQGMSIAIDNNCMGKEQTKRHFEPFRDEFEGKRKTQTELKYVILRENGKLYCQWDDEGSLIF